MTVLALNNWAQVGEWLALLTGSQGPGLESFWRQNATHGCTVLHCTEYFIITPPLSQYDLHNVERDVKHQNHHHHHSALQGKHFSANLIKNHLGDNKKMRIKVFMTVVWSLYFE